MKAEKLTKINLRSLPDAASPFFQLLRLLLAVLRRYSFLCYIFQWLQQIYNYGSSLLEYEHVERFGTTQYATFALAELP